MLATSKGLSALYVDRQHHQWVVKDPNGDFWILPPGETSWDHRELVDLVANDVDLEPIPGHYRYLFDLPF